jgi:hypothetical protein
MGNQAEFKLKYTIESDNSKAKKDVQEVDSLLSKLFGKRSSASGLQSSFKDVASEISNITSALTGDRLSGAASQVTSLAEAFGAIPGPAGLAVGAIAGIGVAAVGAGAALFELTKKASEYGESIYNAQVKTGLHANTLSALQLAAKETGVEFDQVISSFGKFSQQLGLASEGSEKAAKNLVALGLDPKTAADNLDASLGKVLKKIADAPTIVEKNTLAFQAFGKQGKDLIPIIDRVHGNLEEFTKEMEKAGHTIDDQAVVASHEFGEVLTELEDQIGKVAIKLGIALMPTLNRLDVQLSQFFAHHQDDVASAIDKFAFFVTAEVEGWSTIISKVIEYGSAVGKIFQQTFPILSKLFQPFLLGTFSNAYDNFKKEQNSHGVEGTGYGGGVPGGELPDVYGKRIKPPKTTDDQFRKFFTDQGFEVSRTFGDAVNKGSLHPSGKAIDIKIGGKTEDEIAKLIANAIEKGYRFVDERVTQPGVISHGQHLHFEQNLGEKGSIFGPASSYGSVPLDLLKQIDKQRLGKGPGGATAISAFTKTQLDADAKTFETYWNRKLEIEKAGNDNLLALREAELDAVKQGGADYFTANEKASAVEAIKLQQYQEEIDYLGQLEDYYRTKAALTKDTALQTELLNKADETHQKIDVKTIEMQTAKIKLDAEEKNAVKELTDKYYDLNNSLKEQLEVTRQLDELYSEPKSTTGSGSHGPPSFLDQFFGSANIDVYQTNAQIMQGLVTDTADIMGGAFGSMTDAVAQSIEAWELYGGSVGHAMKQATAAVLAQISAQALVKALYYTAEGVASLFFNPPAAAGFFEAAAIDFAIAGGAGLGAHALSDKGKSGKGSGGGSYSYGNNIDKNPSPYTRASQNAYQSGRSSDHVIAAAIDRNTAATEKLHGKLDSMRAGEVLVKGMEERRGVIGRQVVEDFKSNGGLSTQFKKVNGGR